MPTDIEEDLTREERRKAKRKVWYQKNKKAQAVKDKARRAALTPKERYTINRNGWLKRSYGLTESGYLSILRSQSGRCASCNKLFTPGHKPPVVRYDHDSKKVLGIICYSCSQKRYARPPNYCKNHPSRRARARGLCGTCFNRRDEAARTLLKERLKSKYWKNPEKYRAKVRAYQASLPLDVRRKHNRKALLKRKYGITPEVYDQLLKKQDGVCAICKQPPTSERSLCVDHNHERGTIRGLLCTKCNTRLGIIEADWPLTVALMTYADSEDD